MRDSGGSLYLRTMEVPATVLVSAASLPLGAKLGLSFSDVGGGLVVVRSEEDGWPLKASTWEGSGTLERSGGLGGNSCLLCRDGGEDEDDGDGDGECLWRRGFGEKE